MQIKTRILSQVENIGSDLIETFDLYLESVDGKQLIKLECIDPEHANAIETLIAKCVNHVSDYAILYEPETPEEIEKKQEHIDQASREKDI